MPKPRKSASLQPRHPNREETARYIAELTADLWVLASRQGLQTLASLLEIARLEAETVIRVSKEKH